MRQSLRAVIVAVLSLTLLATAPALAQVPQLPAGLVAQGEGIFRHVPTDAVVVVRIKNLQQTSEKIAALAQQFGVAQFNPALNDPLGAAQTMSNLGAGLDKNGEAAFAIFGERKMVALLPVSDYKAFLGNFPDAAAEGNVTRFTRPDDDRPFFAAQWDKYAAITQDKALLSTPRGIATAGLAARELAGKDALVFVNMPLFRAQAVPQIQANREKWLKEMDQALAQGPNAAVNQKLAPIFRSLANRGIDGAVQVMQDATAASLGLSFDNDGISSTSMIEFTPGSPSAQFAARIKGTDKPLLAGLPTGRYILFGGATLESGVLSQLIDDLATPLLAQIQEIGPQGKQVADYIAVLQTGLKAQQGNTFGMLAPTGMPGQGSMFQMIGISTGDAKAIADAQRRMFQIQTDLMKSMAGENTPMPATYSYTANAKTVAGVSFDLYQTKLNLEAAGPEAAQAAMMLNMIYGPNGVQAYTGVLDDRHVLVVAGLDDAMIAKAIAAAKSGDMALANAAPLKSVQAKLPGNRVAELYLPLDAWMATGLNIARMFGMPANVQVAENLPPVGLTFASDGNALRSDTHVPAQLVQSLIATGMQMFMQMQGGGQ